jgi:hypothetical protein
MAGNQFKEGVRKMSELHPTILQVQPNNYRDTTGEFPQSLKLEEAQRLSELRFAEERHVQFKRNVLAGIALSIAVGAIKMNFFGS